MPEAADLLDLHFQRMVDKDPLESDDDYSMSIAEACQFLSTLLVFYPLDVGTEDPRREKLIEKLRGWRKRYRGKFCDRVAERCLDIIEPNSGDGEEMMLMLPMIKMQLEKGIETCNAKECNVGRNASGKQTLLQCARCVTKL